MARDGTDDCRLDLDITVRYSLVRLPTGARVHNTDTTMIYLASPYSHADDAIRAQWFDAACRAAAELMRAGHTVYSPIVHGHPIRGESGVKFGFLFF
jgi:hypothetical protein